MLAAPALQLRAAEARQHTRGAQEPLECRYERRRHHQRPLSERGRHILVLRMHGDGEARRQRPRGRRPDGRRGRRHTPERRRQRLDERVGDVDRGRLVVPVLDFGLGQRGRTRWAPEDGLLAAIDEPVRDAAPEGAHLLRRVGGVHRQVRMLPVAEHAEAPELLALDGDEALRVGAAARAHLALRHRLLLGTSELLLDVQLDREAVAVPARHVRREAPRHRAVLHDDVLQHLVERRAEVDVAVGVGRPVVQDEARFPGIGRQQTLVDARLRPASHRLRLPLGEVRLHREVGARQVERRLVVHGAGRSSVTTSASAGFQREARGAKAASVRSTAAARDSPTGFGNTIGRLAPASR